jgi:hypothetical protein
MAASPIHDGTSPAAALTTVFSGSNCPVSTTSWSDSCLPPNYSSVYWIGDVGYYSPAICPSGYTAACSRFDSLQGPGLESTETAMQCCFSGYSCTSNEISYCVQATSTTSISMRAIQIRWASSDLPSLETHPLTQGLVPTASSTSSSSSSVAPSQTGRPFPTPEPAGGELPVGAKAGIGVGAGVVAIALAVLAFFLIKSYRSKRKGGQKDATINPNGGQVGAGPPIFVHEDKRFRASELEANLAYNYGGHGVVVPPSEIDSSPRQNLQPVELQANQWVRDQGSTVSGMQSSRAESMWTPAHPGPPEHIPVPAESTHGDIEEMDLQSLQKRQSELEARKQRLLQLETIEQEQARLQQEISRMGGQRPS